MSRIYLLTSIFTLTLVLFLSASTVFADRMSSGNYSISTDSINFGGTENGGSSNYVVSDTLGEVGTGVSNSANYGLSAGYRNMQSSFISITASPDAALPSLVGLGGGESVGSTTWRVLTDNIAGYELSIRSNTSPTLKAPSGASFADYVPSGSSPDYFFTVAADSSAFGYTAEGQDIVQKFRDDGGNCNSGSFDTADRCWEGLSTEEDVVSRSESSNQPGGTTTTIKYKAAVGTNKIQDSGAYSADITVTAVTL